MLWAVSPTYFEKKKKKEEKGKGENIQVRDSIITIINNNETNMKRNRKKEENISIIHFENYK